MKDNEMNQPLPKATPDLAKAVWGRQQSPSARSVARALTQSGRPVHFTTVNRWRGGEWRETNQPYSPFFVHPWYRDRVGQHVGWLLTGVGRAYLAFCPEQERESILQRLRKSEKPDDRLARDPKRLEQIFAEVRERAYATRDPIFRGGHYGQPPFDDGLAAIAVPLLDRKRVHASVNILWTRSAFTVEEFAARHLSDLQSAAAEIVSSLHH
jgi:IclR family mhp operon transcriptional activator